ncbi:MAG: radical SAM protein [Thermodesulfobacteriota bacterium]
MRILLVYPYFLEERIQDEDIRPVPIGLYGVAESLKQSGYDVEVLNWHDIHKTPLKIEEALSQKRPDVLGFSILHGNRWGGIDIARTAKRLLPETKVVFGGPGATFLWKHLLTHFPEIDYVGIGEGETTLPELIRHIEKAGDKPPEGVRGIAFRRGRKIVRTPKPPPVQDLDRLPIPARHFVYQHVSSSRGCAWKCRFCGSPRLWEGEIRFRSPEHFVEELELLCRKGVRFFYVSDDTFTVDKDRVIRICGRILERDLKVSWCAISRVDCVDEEILYWMRKAGCTQISYGVESGSGKIRAALNKRISTERIRRAFDLTVRHGILARAYFMYGCPGETWETVEETVTLMMEIRPLAAVFYILDLYPGTGFYEDLKRRGIVSDEIWLNRIEGLMHLETDSRLSGETVIAFGKRLRTAFYENLHLFADAIPLVEKQELFPLHADFCSRLAMTFSHGDYAKNDLVKDKERVAEKLYRRALEYHPDERAFLGLGMLEQRRGNLSASMVVLREGISHFPEGEQLHICLGVSLMNAGNYQEALSIFRRFPGSGQAVQYAGNCETALRRQA